MTVEQAVQTNADELIYHPAALCLRGELRLRADAEGEVHFDSVEQDFREAIDLSRTLQAKSLELRATTSLARLLKGQGRPDEARTMLANIYNWFIEGFDTSDLKEARSLLDQLVA